MKAIICICIGIVLIILVLCSDKTKENFTIAKRTGLFCKPLLSGDSDTNLMPNSITLVIQGYNYKKTPIIYRDGKSIVPLQYSWDYSSMAYYFVVYAPKGTCGHSWILETSDFVEPVVADGRTNENMQVSLIRRRNDFNMWELSC
jgi:hypothetical protein